jgi:flagellar basal-body rod protein FlgB
MYNTVDVLGVALKGTWKRNEAISGNIANVDTPGYKRKDVAFESLLSEALMTSSGKLDKSELAGIIPKVTTDRSSLSYRLDGNNVDIDSEMSYLAENQLKYNALINQVNYKFNWLKDAMGK